MEFEKDLIMRQVRDMARMIAKIVFGKNTAQYEYQEDTVKLTETDSIYKDLICMVDNGKINEAENYLYDEIEKNAEGNYEIALGFYDYLNNLPDSFLTENNYSREEVKEGIQNLAKLKGLAILGEDLEEFQKIFENFRNSLTP